MFKLLWRLVLLVALALFFAWLADRPGSITLHWLGREIETSVVFAAVLLLAALVALSFLWSLLRRLWRSPHAAREFWRFRKQRKGYESLSRGIIAAGAGDAQAALRHAAAAGNALPDEPLVNVLAAQAAQLTGDRTSMRRIFDEMTQTPETELLGLRGLFAEARSAGDLVAAQKHAERAKSLNPRLPWASTAVLQVQTARKDWSAAAATLDQQVRAGLLDSETAARRRAAMLTAQALQDEDGKPADAFTLAAQANGLDSALVPAAAIIARHHIANGNARKATKVLRRTWDYAPHPDIAELLARVQPGEGPEDRFERLRDALGNPPGNLEGAVALARAALAARRTDVARDVLTPYAEGRPQARICALMAQIEDASGDTGRAREWLARSVHAPHDPMWVSDGVASPRWVPVSPVTGEIVPCEWKAPFDALPAPEDDGLLPAAPSPLPAPADSAAVETMPAAPPRPDDPGIAARAED